MSATPRTTRGASWLWAAGPLLALGVSAAAGDKTPSPAPGGETLALVGDVAITLEQIEQRLAGRLAELRSREYNLKRQAIDELIAESLTAKEAAARGISTGELMRLEVDEKAKPVSEEDRKAAYEANRQRFQGKSEADAMRSLEASLKQQRVRERRAQFVKELREKATVRILLEPPRVAVDAGDDPSKGPATAPVTIVEFSDFQCPYCARVNPTLKRVEETYGDKVRRVFRDFPLNIHPQAPKAAEAATCAAEQGKFWEMHDKLFANQGKLQVPELKRYAGEIGLDGAAFDSCLDSGRQTSEWQKDMADGTRYGVSATPAFFINGRQLMGAQPFESFTQVIEDELERAKATPHPGATAPQPDRKAKPRDKKGS